MKVAILIGFSYGEDADIDSREIDLERNPLPGIIIDLYQAYQISTNMKVDKVLVITDIVKDQQTSVLMNAMLESTVSSDILTFVEDIRRDKVYHYYSDRENFIASIEAVLSGAEEAFIYYTGHVQQGHIIFPYERFNITLAIHGNEQSNVDFNIAMDLAASASIDPLGPYGKLAMVKFRDIILHLTSRDAQIFIVMDCCNGTGLELPFQLIRGVYRLTNQNKHQFPSQEVICLSSAMADESSATSRDGSIFTRSLIRQIKKRIQSLASLIKIVGEECFTRHDQTATVHSSYPDTKAIWNWMYGTTQTGIGIDFQSNTIIIDFDNRRVLFLPSQINRVCLSQEPVSRSNRK